MEGKKVYSLDEIKKIAPGYRGKPANFDPTKVGKKSAPPRKPKEPSTNEKSRPGPSSDQLPPPARPQRAPTVQRNESIISESIFGVDVSVTEISLRQEFGAHRYLNRNLSELPCRREATRQDLSERRSGVLR
jgi:hypothetical protein